MPEGTRKLLFDTSASIEWLNGNTKLLEITDRVTISTITEYELLWSAIEKGKKYRIQIENYLENVFIKPVSSEISRKAALVQANLRSQGNQKSMADLLIAATAKQFDLPLCSFDKDFQSISKELDIELIVIKV